MKVYNEDKTIELTEYDLTKGYLVSDTETIDVQEVVGQQMESYVIDGVYTIVKPYIKHVPAHTEERPCYRYVPYTEEELAEIERKQQVVEYQNEKSQLEEWLREHDYIGVKIATERATVEDYADEIQEMESKAERINTLNELIGGNN